MTPRLSLLLTAVLALASTPAMAQSSGGTDDFSLTPTAYLQLDWRGYPDWNIAPGTGRLTRETWEVRRLRAGVDGTWKRATFEFSVDPTDDDGVVVKDAFLRLRFGRAFNLQAGQFKLPGASGYGSSARRIGFLERSALSMSLAARRDTGMQADGRLGAFQYAGGVFAGDNVGNEARSGVTAAGRLQWRVVRDLTVGTFGSVGRTSAVESDPANGYDARSTTGYRFAQAVYVQGIRARVGASAEWTPGSWRLEAEGLRLRDTRHEQGVDLDDLPAAIGTGLTASIRREFGRNASSRGWTAFRWLAPSELGARYDRLRVDDAATGTDATGTDSVRPRAANIRARGYHGLTLGSTWRLHAHARVLGNLGLETYSDARSAPQPGGTGGYLTAGARLQLEWR
ncbi:MAG: porin [Vicinamibacterales bacterium]|nr:porin [Vicinamibacterales bacterium]